MNSTRKERQHIRIIACGVFKPALEHIRLQEKFPNIQVTYLPSNLHLQPGELKVRLSLEVTKAQEKNERIICLYGECFPGIGDVCQDCGALRMKEGHCHQILLGPKQFDEVMNETAGTYFLEQELITNFENYCMGPLELDDDEMRHIFFDHYNKILYVHQPSDPDIEDEASCISTFLDLPLEIKEADYSHLEQQLTEMILSCKD